MQMASSYYIYMRIQSSHQQPQQHYHLQSIARQTGDDIVWQYMKTAHYFIYIYLIFLSFPIRSPSVPFSPTQSLHQLKKQNIITYCKGFLSWIRIRLVSALAAAQTIQENQQ
jgi:hypothetical protein